MAKENKKEISFVEGPIFQSLIRFALPVLGALILQAAYGAVDLLVVGWFGDASSISAVGTGSNFMQMVTFIITSLAMGSTVMIGQHIGEGKPDMAGKTVRVDKVDFPNEEVSLTDITDRKNPVPFHERLSIVRSYVEDAPAESLWKATDRREHTSQKKTSVLAKLKEHAQTAPDKGAKKPERTKKPKSKEMEM